MLLAIDLHPLSTVHHSVRQNLLLSLFGRVVGTSLAFFRTLSKVTCTILDRQTGADLHRAGGDCLFSLD